MNRDFYLDVFTILNSDLINNMDHMRISSRVLNPRQWSLAKQSNSKSWKVLSQKCQIKFKPNGMV